MSLVEGGPTVKPVHRTDAVLSLRTPAQSMRLAQFVLCLLQLHTVCNPYTSLPPCRVLWKKLSLCTCSLRSSHVKADVVQPCHVTDSVYQEGSSLEKTCSPSLDLTWHCLFQEDSWEVCVQNLQRIRSSCSKALLANKGEWAIASLFSKACRATKHFRYF